MNTLAHLLLAGNDTDLQIGALLGDAVKGPLKGEWPAGWERGIALHRRIDRVTDGHQQVANLLAALPADFRRWGGIMLDVAFDHSLARDWSHYHHQPLEAYSHNVLTELTERQAQFPAESQQLLARLRSYRILPKLSDPIMVNRLLAGIGQRLRHSNPLASAGPVLAHLQPQIDQAFTLLYPDLQSLQKEFRA